MNYKKIYGCLEENLRKIKTIFFLNKNV